MELTKSEEKILAGSKGEIYASAYRVLLAIGQATEAKKLVPIKWAHVSGVNYNTIGDAGVDFLQEISNVARFRVRTTINPMGYDRSKSNTLSGNFLSKQMQIVESYKKMGAIQSFSCTPYEIFQIPKRGTPVSFAESSAAVFSNSFLGLMTNRESALSALASAITGKSPYSDLRIEESRTPGIAMKCSGIDITTETDYGLLGYVAGKIAKDSCIAFSGFNSEMDMMPAKAISAGLGTSGACGMFTSGGGEQSRESVGIDKEEMSKAKSELNTDEDGDLILFGSPQLGLSELAFLHDLIGGRKFDKRCIIFCSRYVHDLAKKIGLASDIQSSGAEFMCDSCMCLSPLITRDNTDSIITNSVKGAYYMKSSNRVGVALKDMKTIVRTYS
ncbi:MAG TPA: aconitase X catalytic domain-containing protein [Nitrososphaeraceae archaeon]|nr:aconitase X catalytic domain-containing protein [Nitrososphaeraceae archaeon]